MSQLKIFSEDIEQCVEWGNKAIEIANEINDQETLCHALANIGTSQGKIQLSKEEGKKTLMESLGIAMRNSFHEHAARAYSNLINNCIELKDYQLAKQFLNEGISYCEESGLDSFTSYMLALKSRMLLETGDWKGSTSIAQNLLENILQPETIKVDCHIILGTIKLRSGEPDAIHHLQEAKALSFMMKEHRRVIRVVIALLEHEWITSRKILLDEELNQSFELAKKVNSIFLNDALVFWLKKTRNQDLAEKSQPDRFLQAGKIAMAASFWQQLGCPYEKALALFQGKEGEKMEALSILSQLGANAVVERNKMEMRAAGIKTIPRGPRPSTKANPAQLTNREIDVLQLLQKGIQNKEIAGMLFISPKTTEHHISSILFKLDVNSRLKAVDEAIRLGILE